MKIRLTEEQIRKVKLITEGQERVDEFINKAEDIRERVNRLYSKLTFSTISEILEGDIDLDTMLNQIERLRTVMYTYYKRAEDFFDSMPENDYYSDNRWEDLQDKSENVFEEVTYDKIDIIEDLINKLKDFSDDNIEEKFKDIKKMDI